MTSAEDSIRQIASAAVGEDDLHVLQVDTADVGGGAERVMTSLHRTYLERGVDSWLAVGTRSSDLENVVELPNEELRGGWARSLAGAAAKLGPSLLGRLASRALLFAAEPLRYAAIARGIEDFDYPGTARLLDLTPQRPDVLHLHNLHGYYFDLRMLPKISATQPTILTLHDTWALTGHCAHPLDCPHWHAGCGDCPDLQRYVPIRRDASARNFQLKRAALQHSALSYATPSEWLMRMVGESGLLDTGAAAKVIPNGVDTAVFRPGDRLAERRSLGLPSNAHVVLFAGTNLRVNPFKDYATLAEALRALAGSRSDPVVLVALGDSTGGEVPDGVEMRSVPYVSDQQEVARYYRAADLYVHAARAENFPLAIIEAMACGIPVVASRVGGIPEIVREDETGLLVEPGDPRALARAMASLLDDSAVAQSFAAEGLARVRLHFTLERQVGAYLDWYDQLLGR